VPVPTGTEATVVATTLETPPKERVTVPLLVGLALTICVVFTIVAGVSSPVITFARQATTLF
jgi:hypothetical protein